MKLRMLNFRVACSRAFVLPALAVVLGSGAAQAQKFAIIDMQKAVLATSDGRKATEAINTKFAPLKTQIDQLAKDIQAKQDAFTKNRATMSPSAAAAAQAEIESMTTSFNRKREDAQQDLNEEENKQLGVIVPKLQQIITQYAAANGITFVLDTSTDRNNLIYGDGSLNIISPVVLAYEKAAGTAAAAPTTPPAAAPPAPKTSTPATTVPRTAAPGK